MSENQTIVIGKDEIEAEIKLSGYKKYTSYKMSDHSVEVKGITDKDGNYHEIRIRENIEKELLPGIRLKRETSESRSGESSFVDIYNNIIVQPEACPVEISVYNSDSVKMYRDDNYDDYDKGIVSNDFVSNGYSYSIKVICE